MQQNVNTIAQLAQQAGRSVPDVQQLLAANPAPSRDQIIQLQRFSLGDIGTLSALPQVGRNWNNLVLLATRTNRTAPDIQALAALQMNNRVPDLGEILALNRFSNANIQALMPRAANWGELVTLAASTRTTPDILILTAINPAPTVPQLSALDRFTNANIQTLMLRAANWGELVNLATSTRTTPDILTLAAIQIGGQRPTVTQMSALERFTNADIQTLAPRAANWGDLVTLVGSARSTPDLLAVAALQINGQQPTAAQINALERFTNANIQSLMPRAANWGELATLAASTRTTPDILTLAVWMPAPTAAQLSALDRFSNANIQTLMPRAANWGELVTLAASTRTTPDILALAAMQVNGQQPTAPQMAAMDHLTSANIQTINTGLPQIATWADTVQVASLNQSIDAITPLVLRGVLQTANATLLQDVNRLNPTLGFQPTLAYYSALLVDLNANEISQAIQAGGTLFADYLRDPRYFAACFDGADRLRTLLGTENVAILHQSGGGARQEYPLAQQITRGNTLITHLQAASQAGAARIFRIHLGGHGFCLIVNGNIVYQLETLAAGPVGLATDTGTLYRSILNGYYYPLATVLQNIQRMTGNSVANRLSAAAVMHWNAGPIGILAAQMGVYNQVQDPMTVYWTASALKTPTQIRQDFTQKISAESGGNLSESPCAAVEVTKGKLRLQEEYLLQRGRMA